MTTIDSTSTLAVLDYTLTFEINHTSSLDLTLILTRVALYANE